jgi:hypothetical protein
MIDRPPKLVNTSFLKLRKPTNPEQKMIISHYVVSRIFGTNLACLGQNQTATAMEAYTGIAKSHKTN